MFMCDVTKMSPYLRNFVYSDDYCFFVSSDVSIRFKGRYDIVTVFQWIKLCNKSVI